MQFLSDFADQRLLLPLGVVLAAALALSGWWRGALAWLTVVAGTLGCMALLKVVFLACGARWTDGVLNSPSGHTASAALFYGGFALLVLRPRVIASPALLMAPPLLAVLVGLSRLALHVHTPAEVLVGGTVGTAGAFLLPWLAGPPPRLPLRRFLLLALPLLALLHGSRLYAEPLFRRFEIAGLWPPPSCRMPAEPAGREAGAARAYAEAASPRRSSRPAAGGHQ